MSELLLDAAGRRRSPATLPEFHAGRPPRNKGTRYPADPPTIEEIVTVMRHAGDGVHGRRLRGLIVVLSRAGLRIHEALALAQADLDPRRGSLLVRRGKGGRRREVGMDDWPGSSWRPGWTCGSSCRSGRCSASSTAPRAGGPGRPPPPPHRAAPRRPRGRRAPPLRAAPTQTRPRRPPLRAHRVSKASANPRSTRSTQDPWPGCHITRISNTPTSASPRSTCKASTTQRSSTPSTPAAHRWSPSAARCESEGSKRPAAGKLATSSPPALVQIASHEPGGERLAECSNHREAATHAA